MWELLGTAFALMLILEGITPFLNPAQLRKMILFVLKQSDTNLRTWGLISMLTGLTLLYLIK